MPAYIHGNLAIEERKTKQAVRVRETKKVVYKKKSIPTQEKLLYLFTIAVCVLVAGVIIWRYAQIYEVNTKMQQIEQEIKMLENENKSLKLEVYKLQDPKRLIEKAKEMGFQTEDQEVNNTAAHETKNDGNIALNP